MFSCPSPHRVAGTGLRHPQRHTKYAFASNTKHAGHYWLACSPRGPFPSPCCPRTHACPPPFPPLTRVWAPDRLVIKEARPPTRPSPSQGDPSQYTPTLKESCRDQWSRHDTTTRCPPFPPHREVKRSCSVVPRPQPYVAPASAIYSHDRSFIYTPLSRHRAYRPP